ncbi:hypothetical protein [Pseudonocardia sp. N23]|uniref:hypothetical protein n=1 Tax=Pseudonocardia sp. N23 TaxID=1987376 RepID=UPI000BFCE4AB|nr:hypothetical protein [Pseudonocardia sp. N23]GAY12061.1 hypothetical protein TOK_0451 [Pseudonocardia sp. N23]
MSQADVDRYHAAMHAMQSGVAAEMFRDPKPTEPKHLRVGVNSALLGSAAIGALLIEKGVITQDDYERAMADQAEREKAAYEERLGVHLH